MIAQALVVLAAASAVLSSPILGSAYLDKRQNEPAFGGWDKGENVTDLVQELQVVPNPIDGYVKLPADGLFFDFLKAKNFGGGGPAGGVVLADNTIYPETVNTELSILVGFIGPCGMVAPHNHPRAAEFLMNVAGPPLSAGSFNENGSPYYQGNLEAGQVVSLPLGSMHYISNEGCDPALIVSGFNSASPGVGFLSSMYDAFDPETIQAAFAPAGKTPTFDNSKVSGAVSLGHQKCLQKCGLQSSFNLNGKLSNHDLMKMAFAGYLQSEKFDSQGYSAEDFKIFNN